MYGKLKSNVMAHACNPNIMEVKIGVPEVKVILSCTAYKNG